MKASVEIRGDLLDAAIVREQLALLELQRLDLLDQVPNGVVRFDGRTEPAIFRLKLQQPSLQPLVLLHELSGELRPFRESPEELIPLLAQIVSRRIAAIRLTILRHNSHPYHARPSTSLAFRRRAALTLSLL